MCKLGILIFLGSVGTLCIFVAISNKLYIPITGTFLTNYWANFRKHRLNTQQAINIYSYSKVHSS